MLLSLSGFLFENNYKSQSVTFPQFCELARSAGYTGAELRGTQVDPDTPASERKALLSMAADHGLPVTCLTARGMPGSGQEREDFYHRYLDLCRDMECRLLKIGGEPEWLRKAADEANAYKVTLASNNHVGGILETVEGTRQHFKAVAHPNYGLLFDALHLSVTGQDYLGCIPDFFGSTRNILVHSCREAKPGEKASLEKDGKGWVSPALPDEPGVQDWAGVFRAFKHLKYDGLITVIEAGWLVEQREEVARHCAKVMQRLWDEA